MVPGAIARAGPMSSGEKLAENRRFDARPIETCTSTTVACHCDPLHRRPGNERQVRRDGTSGCSQEGPRSTTIDGQLSAVSPEQHSAWFWP
jgi:hypothetical protein